VKIRGHESFLVIKSETSAVHCKFQCLAGSERVQRASRWSFRISLTRRPHSQSHSYYLERMTCFCLPVTLQNFTVA